MLRYRKGAKSSVKRVPSLCDNGLFQEEREIHLPDAGHFVEEDNRPFEKRIYFEEFCPVDRRIASSEVFDPEFKVLQHKDVSDCLSSEQGQRK